MSNGEFNLDKMLEEAAVRREKETIANLKWQKQKEEYWAKSRLDAVEKRMAQLAKNDEVLLLLGKVATLAISKKLPKDIAILKTSTEANIITPKTSRFRRKWNEKEEIEKPTYDQHKESGRYILEGNFEEAGYWILGRRGVQVTGAYTSYTNYRDFTPDGGVNFTRSINGKTWLGYLLHESGVYYTDFGNMSNSPDLISDRRELGPSVIEHRLLTRATMGPNDSDKIIIAVQDFLFRTGLDTK